MRLCKLNTEGGVPQGISRVYQCFGLIHDLFWKGAYIVSGFNESLRVFEELMENLRKD